MSNSLLPVIVAAEDEESDAFILRLACKKAGVLNSLLVVEDGTQVVDYLNGNGAHPAVRPVPALLLLDLKMPRMSGFDVLAWLATRPELRELPVVVLSSSSDQADIAKARQLGARDYIVKPHSLSDFVEIIRKLEARWLSGPPPQPASRAVASARASA